MLDLELGTIDRTKNREVWAGVFRLFDLVRTASGWIVRLHISDYPPIGEYPSLHSALTRGFEVTSNLLAHRLLENRSTGSQAELGVRLWHTERLQETYYLKTTIHKRGLIYDESLGTVTRLTNRDWEAGNLRDAVPYTGDSIRCATEEQAMAVILKAAAPWIALSVIEAFEPETA